MSDELDVLKGWRKLPPVPRPATVLALRELAEINTIAGLKQSPHYYPPYQPYRPPLSVYEPEQQDEDLD